MRSQQEIVRDNKIAQAHFDATHIKDDRKVWTAANGEVYFENPNALDLCGSFQVRNGLIVPIGESLLAAIEPSEDATGSTEEPTPAPAIVAQVGAVVFAVIGSWDYDGDHLVDLYNTREAAEAAKTAQVANYDHVNVEEWTIKA